jgi:Cytidine and deoxycytidylate deaminase zinc-binding region
MALRQAGNQSHGACLYVTLEPCSHFGRTPPCVDALIQAGIEGAHIATLDPNPRVDGTGARTLRTHGIHVTLGPCVERAQELIQPHAKFTRTGVPYLTLLLDLPVSVGREFDEQADFVLDWKMAGVDGQFIPELQKELASEGRIVWSLRATRDQAADWLRLGAVDRIISVPGLPIVPGFEYQRELSTHEQPVILYRRVASLQ